MAIRKPMTWVFALAVVVLASSGCSVDTTPNQVDVRFLEINGASVQSISVLTWDDDVDGQMPGIQVSVRLGVPGLATGTTVQLCVGDQQLEAQTSASGDVEFTGVTLQPGANLLEADCDRCQKGQLTAEVFAPALDISDFVSETITAYTHDTDQGADGIQHEFLILALQVPDGVEIDVQVGEEAYTIGVLGEQALLALTLPADGGEMAVQAEAIVGDILVSVAGTIRVQGAPCEIVSIGGAPLEELLDAGEAIWLGQDRDQSTAPGFQADVVIHAGGLPGTWVELLVDGEVLADVAQDESGHAVVEGVMLEGDFSLQVRCRLQDVPDVNGQTFDAHVDTTPPAAVTDLTCTMVGSQYHCQWTSPEDPGRAEAVGQWELRYLVGGELSSESYANATLVPTMPLPDESGVRAQVMFQILEPQPGAISFALMSWDLAGNSSPVSNIFTISAE